MTILDLNIIQSIYKKRNSNSHKGNHGHALLIAGSETKMGAAVISSKACLRAGVGLLTVSVPKSEKTVIFSSIPEAMIAFREDKIEYDAFNVIAVGPGIGVSELSKILLEKIILNYSNPMVFDADAITILSNNLELVSKLPKNSILTPHVKEFDRLFGNHSTNEVRIEKAIAKAKDLQCIIVLKSHQTIVTNGKETYLNTNGNSGLAKGGSGDALTGIITSFVAQGYEPFAAAQFGVFIHGLAADSTLETQSHESMLITDVIENLGMAFKKLLP